MLNGQTKIIEIRTDETVGKMKDMICDFNGILPRDQVLMYAGKQLEDWRTLESYKIERESMVHFVLRLCGD